MDLVKSFTAKGDKTVSLTPTTTSARVQLSQTQVQGLSRGAVRIFNNTGSVVFILFGVDNTVVATTAAMPIASGEVEVIGIAPDVAYVAAILASGTAAGPLYFTHGEGL